MRVWTLVWTGWCCLSTAASWAEEKPAAEVRPRPADDAVVVFIIDNSASVPPLDPRGHRRAALEKLYGFVEGQPYRLILFGGKREVDLDAPWRYQNRRRWTDFYFAFKQVEEIIAAYPPGTQFKQILITDGVLDPSPEDWDERREWRDAELYHFVAAETLEQLQRLRLPLYVILVGDAVESSLVAEMVRAANGGVTGSDLVQGISEFFEDDGLLVRRFIYRLEPDHDIEEFAPVVRRIVSPPQPRVELSLLGSVLLVLALVIGVGVRSFPGAGDQEIVELRRNEPMHIATDRLRRLPWHVPAWSWKGLSLVEDSKSAAATLTLVDGNKEFPPEGLDLSGLDATARELIHLPIPELSERLRQLQSNGDKDQVIYALNLDYVARDFDPNKASRLLSAAPSDRRRIDAMEFLRAKAHLLHDDTLYHRLSRPRVSCLSYGPNAQKRELREGTEVAIGRYQFKVEKLASGGRKDYRLVLSYERVPSVLKLKELVPSWLQQALRFRRAHERLVR